MNSKTIINISPDNYTYQVITCKKAVNRLLSEQKTLDKFVINIQDNAEDFLKVYELAQNLECLSQKIKCNLDIINKFMDDVHFN